MKTASDFLKEHGLIEEINGKRIPIHQSNDYALVNCMNEFAAYLSASINEQRNEKVKLLVSERLYSGQLEAEIAKLKEWLTDYRDGLKRHNVYHIHQGTINAINELLV